MHRIFGKGRMRNFVGSMCLLVGICKIIVEIKEK